MIPHTKEELALLKKGYQLIAGIDEVGRGSLAGPVVAAAVIMPLDHLEGGRKKHLQGVRDSKLILPKKREELFEEILSSCIAYGVGVVGCRMIDDVNIYQATKIAMKKAVDNIQNFSDLSFHLGGEQEDYTSEVLEYKTLVPNFLLVDAMNVDTDIPQKAIIKGDMICYSISCASIIAKVTRDRMMADFHEKYPEYGFDAHKGYGTKVHMEALGKHGASNIHRKSYKPISILENPNTKN